MIEDIPATTAPRPGFNFPERIMQPIPTSRVVTQSDKPNSYEFGKAGSRHKVYYNNIEELKELVKQAYEVDKLRAELDSEVNKVE